MKENIMPAAIAARRSARDFASKREAGQSLFAQEEARDLVPPLRSGGGGPRAKRVVEGGSRAARLNALADYYERALSAALNAA